MAEYTIFILCILIYGYFVKTYSFLLFRLFIKKSNGLAGSRWPFLIRIHILLQIYWFALTCINIRVNSLCQINGITGFFFCRGIYSICLKCFWGNFEIIPRIYKCESFTETFKILNQLWILDQFFVAVSVNTLNIETLLSCAQTYFLIGIIL